VRCARVRGQSLFIEEMVSPQPDSLSWCDPLLVE
jgi:hypothetical protein